MKAPKKTPARATPAVVRRAAEDTARQAAAVDAYDSCALEIEQANSLTGLLAQRLRTLDNDEDEPIEATDELFALSLIAAVVSDKLALILTNARVLHGHTLELQDHIFNLENGRRPGKGERARVQTSAHGRA